MISVVSVTQTSFLPFLSNSSLQQVVIDVFFAFLDTVALLSSHVGCDPVSSHAVGDALDAGLEVQPVFRGKLRGHSQIAQSTLVFLLQIHNC